MKLANLYKYMSLYTIKHKNVYQHTQELIYIYMHASVSVKCFEHFVPDEYLVHRVTGS